MGEEDVGNGHEHDSKVTLLRTLDKKIFTRVYIPEEFTVFRVCIRFS